MWAVLAPNFWSFWDPFLGSFVVPDFKPSLSIFWYFGLFLKARGGAGKSTSQMIVGKKMRFLFCSAFLHSLPALSKFSYFGLFLQARGGCKNDKLDGWGKEQTIFVFCAFLHHPRAGGWLEKRSAGFLGEGTCFFCALLHPPPHFQNFVILGYV